MEETLEKLAPPKILPATDAAIAAYLRRSYKIAEIAALAEREALILSTCEQLGISVSEQELQAAGDAFRLEHNLLGAAATIAWLKQQRITVEDWSQGIRIRLLEQKLKEYLFSETVDSHYLNNRDRYKRVALSQIFVFDRTQAEEIVRMLREEKASFCVLASEYSKSKHSQENGGFAGVQFLTELMPEIAAAIAKAKEGEIIGPIQTKRGYHIIRVEKWFPIVLDESVNQRMMETLFRNWLIEQINSGHHG